MFRERYDRAFELLCRRMKESPDLKPKSKKMIFRDAKAICGEKLGWGIFCNAWKDALVEVPQAALVWGAAGAPKKSYAK